MRLRYFLLLILLLLNFVGNAQYELLLNKTYAQRYQSLDTLFFHPNFWKLDSVTAYKKIEAFEKFATKHNDRELILEVINIKCSYYRNSGHHDNTHNLAALHNLAKKAKEQHILYLEIEAHYLLSLEYAKLDKFGLSFEHQMRYYNLLQKVSSKEYPPKKDLVYHMGSLHFWFKNYDLARKYLLEADSLPSSYKQYVNDEIRTALGLLEREVGNYNKAIEYFSLCLDSEEPIYSVSLGNIGITHYLQGNYKKAIPLLRVDIEKSLARKDHQNAANSLVKLADIYYKQGNYDSALYLCNTLRYIIKDVWHPYRTLVPAYDLFRKLAYQRGDKDLAYKFADSTLFAKDSLSNRDQVLSLANAQHKVEIERHAAEVKEIVTEKELGVSKRNNIISLLSLSTIIALLLFNRQNIRRKRFKAEKELADNKLAHAQQRLSAFTKTIHEKNELLETSTQEIMKLRNAQTEDELPHDLLRQLQKTTILTDGDWEEFKDIFEQVHTGFLYRLKEKVPNLTPAETRYIVLCKLKFDNKEMTNILGIGLSTNRNQKFRLRKKLEIKDDAAFAQFLNNI